VADEVVNPDDPNIPKPEADEGMRTFEARLVFWLTSILSTLAVFAAIAVMVVGAAFAVAENDYTAANYLSDLKTLVFGLAAVLIALELPTAIHDRFTNDRSRRAADYRHRR
jgi:uncharacterized membrane protein (DUF373 family)